MIFIQNNSQFNMLNNYISIFPELPIDSKSIDDFNLSYTSTTNPILNNNSFLEKKRLQRENSLYDYGFINTINDEDYFNDIKGIFPDEDKLDPEWESTCERTNECLANKLFKTNKIKNRGRKCETSNNGQIHDKYSWDNIITKIQAHYMSFLINLANDIIKTCML